MNYLFQVILGCILGDGRLDKPEAGNSRLLVRHSIKQLDYVIYKHSLLKPYSLRLFVVEWFDKRTGKEYKAVGFNTKRDKLFTELYRVFYPKNRKVIPDNISELANEIALAIFIGDDGTWDPTARTVKISVDSYDNDSRINIKKWLDNLGIEATIEKDRIYILRRAYPHFIKLIRSYLPPTMHYKLGLTSPRTL